MLKFPVSHRAELRWIRFDTIRLTRLFLSRFSITFRTPGVINFLRLIKIRKKREETVANEKTEKLQDEIDFLSNMRMLSLIHI